MSLRLGSDQQALARFNEYFIQNTLSNEFILILLHSSNYFEDFQAFLSSDPLVWIKEAKIKDVDRQIKFFRSVVLRDFSEIRTKRRAKEAIEKLIKAKAVASSTGSSSSD